MKKMQCEVCGSTEIKKVSDTIFECQSCGVQYTKDEVQKLLVELTGEVKIDRTEEIENALTRAEQFWKSGDSAKAAEYYNKVLDLDPQNEAALKAIHEINEKNASQIKQEQTEAIRRSSSVKVLKHTIDPSDGVAHFLKALKNAPDIAPDVYKEIEIISVNQGYYPFSVVDKQYSGTYEGVACYRKQVPYTDYETRTDYHNKNQDGSYRKMQVAVTKYREEIERQNANGTYVVGHFGIYSLSQKLNGMFTSIAPDKFDAALSDDEYYDEILDADLQRKYYNDVVLKQLEIQATGGYKAIDAALTDIRTAEQKTIGELEIFNDASDTGWENRITDVCQSEVRSESRSTVEKLIPGDYAENVSYRWFEKYSNVQTIYLPIQVIEYAYRGKFYLSAMLLTKSSRAIHSYPCHTELKAAENQNEKAVANVQQKLLPTGMIIMYCFLAAGIISTIGFAFQGETDVDLLLGMGAVFTLPLGIPVIIWHILWSRKKNKEIREQLLGGSEIIDSIKTKLNAELTNEYTEFFKVFTDLASVENAAAAAKNISAYSCDISSIKGRTVSASVSGDKATSGTNNAPELADITDTNGQELAEGCQYTIRIINSGSDKMAVYKTIRQSRGIGLAEAKEIADTAHCVVAQGLSAYAATDLATNLKIAGAAIEIEKEM